ncbi:MAG TPA: hypothetical protein VK540_21695 [Polyangiaceae bacterium]|nr:hypothetical protein [Polyangiaceae bacterium]
MGDNGGGSPAARALAPPSASAGEGAISGARLATPRSQEMPASIARPGDGESVASPAAEGDWATFATAPTLLATPREAAHGNDVAPPSMRPPAESAATSPLRAPPDPRVVKIVAGVIGACLLIVVVAGAKLFYQKVHASNVVPAPIEGPSAPVTPPATADRANLAQSASENASARDPQHEAETTTPSNATPSSSATGAEATRRTPAHSSPRPTRVTAKPRRAPVPKKVVKSTR